MKKLITILILFLASYTAFGQDGLNQTPAYYAEVKSKTIAVAVDDIVQFAIDVTENLEHQYSYLRRVEKDRLLSVVYQLDKVNNINYQGYDNLILTFSVNKEASSDDLFADRSDLRKITGNKETLISIWKTYFLKNATEKQILENFKYRVLKDEISFLNPKGTGIHFQLVDKGPFWIIENRSRQ